MNASWLPRRAAAKNMFALLDFRFVWFALMLVPTHAACQRSTLPNNMYTKRNTPHTLQPATAHWPIMGRAFARTDNRFALPVRTLPAFSRYSVRSACIGSMEAARQAGNAHAIMATRKRSDAAKTSVRGSRELLPTRAVTRRLRITLRPKPTAIPIPSVAAVEASTS